MNEHYYYCFCDFLRSHVLPICPFQRLHDQPAVVPQRLLAAQSHEQQRPLKRDALVLPVQVTIAFLVALRQQLMAGRNLLVSSRHHRPATLSSLEFWSPLKRAWSSFCLGTLDRLSSIVH